MSLIVQKFGGSSIADAERLLHSAELVKAAYDEGDEVIVVVSAQGDATDRLLQKARELSPAPSLRELDALLTVGEQASAALFSMALQTLGVRAASISAWQAPIESIGPHGNADIARIGQERIQAALAAHCVIVVAGFQAINGRGNLVTLGRGGSDYSAVALSVAFHAKRCVIYTDVDGVYTADPRVCSTARRLERISYADMYALSRAGAQVLHDKCVALAQVHGVEPEVRACHADSLGTRVCEQGESCGAVGVTHLLRTGEASAVVTVVGDASLEIEKRVLSALDEAQIHVESVEASERALAFYVPRDVSELTLCIVHDTLFS